jgi:hypothetical protein
LFDSQFGIDQWIDYNFRGAGEPTKKGVMGKNDF